MTFTLFNPCLLLINFNYYTILLTGEDWVKKPGFVLMMKLFRSIQMSRFFDWIIRKKLLLLLITLIFMMGNLLSLWSIFRLNFIPLNVVEGRGDTSCILYDANEVTWSSLFSYSLLLLSSLDSSLHPVIFFERKKSYLTFSFLLLILFHHSFLLPHCGWNSSLSLSCPVHPFPTGIEKERERERQLDHLMMIKLFQ